MPTAFLSHSSKQKWFVDIVAERLGKDNIVYDKWTFEEGNKTIDEILHGISKSDIFCFFISEEALESDWVKREILEAGEKIAANHLKVFYPIIIDSSIQYSDARIPEWMQKQYNIKFISKPTKAAERIKQKFKLLSWEISPNNKKFGQLFIGRTELIKAFEERIWDYEKMPPSVIAVSGLPSIGRRKFITHCLKNANKINAHYQPPVIFLTSRNSIEDFIFSLHDLGYSDIEKEGLIDLMKREMQAKIELAVRLVEEIRQHEYLIYVVDNYSIIAEDGSLVDWFSEFLNTLKYTSRLNLILISRVRLKHYLINYDEAIFPININELEPYERKALFTALLDIQGTNLPIDEFNTITESFSGFPEQIQFAFNLLVTEGKDFVLRHPNLIAEYNSEKVYSILKKYEKDDLAYSILRLICEFDFISMNFLNEIINDGNEDQTNKIIEDFANNFIIEFIGATKEYIRASDAIRDFVYRSGKGIKKIYHERIQENAKTLMQNYESEDYSNFMITVKEALKTGGNVPDSLLIPSHFLNAMRELYNLEKKFTEVIALADRVLYNERFLDSRVVREIRYYLCLALARKRDKRLLREVQNINGPDHSYLLGFYYRLTRNYEEAIARLQQVLDEIPYSQKAKRELVQVYLNLDDFYNALDYAREVYENDKSNPYNLQSYFRCLVKQYGRSKRNELLELLANYKKINNEKATEMEMISRTQYYGYVENNFTKALQCIDEAIYLYEGNFYPLLTRLELCRKFNNWTELEKTLQLIESNFKTDSEVFNKVSYLSSKAVMMTYKGFNKQALAFIDTKIRHKFPDHVYSKVLAEIEETAKTKLF